MTDTATLWTPLAGVLAICAVIGTRVSFDIEGTLFWDGSFLPIICAAALLGPAPAVAITLVSELAVWRRERYRARVLPLNLVGTVVPNLLAGVVMEGFDGRSGGAFYVALAAVVCGSIALNAVLVTALAGLLYDAPVLERLRRHRGIVAPIAVNVVLAMGAVAVYGAEGLAATAFVMGGVFVFAFVANRLAADREHRTRIRELAATRGRLVAQILEAEDRERRVIADEVHDNLVQTLLVARQDLIEATDVADLTGFRLLREIDAAIDQARRLIRATHPSVLEQVGLEAALRAIAEQSATRGKLEINLVLDPNAVGVHDPLVFSAVRELLANVVKHSRASHAQISLSRSDAGLDLRVTDDGVGLELASTAERVNAGHIGLVSLAERVASLDGEMQVANRRPGTVVSITLPIDTTTRASETAAGPALASVGQD